VTVDPSRLIREPLVPLPDPSHTLAGQMRAEGRSDDEIAQAYEELFGVDARRVLGWDQGQRIDDLHWVDGQ
jgi:hypothetical protein